MAVWDPPKLIYDSLGYMCITKLSQPQKQPMASYIRDVTSYVWNSASHPQQKILYEACS